MDVVPRRVPWIVIAGALTAAAVAPTAPVPATAGEEESAMLEQPACFLPPEDCDAIRAAARTEWGSAIVDAVRRGVRERLEHPLTAPEEEAGHFHNYFCPEHRRILEFAWDRPHRHRCPDCDRDLVGDRYDQAWRQVANGINARFMRDCALLSIVDDDPSHLDPARTLLLDYADRYPGWRIHGHGMQPDAPYGGRMMSQTLDESVWLITVAPAIERVLPDLDEAQRRHLLDDLVRPMSETIRRHRAGGNWQVWHNAGLTAAGLLLDDDEILDVALRDPECGYDHMLRTGVHADGWWGEGSPGYHFYPLHAMILTAEAVRCRGIDLYDGRLRALFDAPIDATYADLAFPAHNDGWHGVSLASEAGLYEIAALRFDDDRYREALRHAYADHPRKHWLALIHGREILPDPTPWERPSTLYPATGVALLRSGPRTVVLKFGPHGGGHGHPDKLSISIHDGVREILPDLGTTGYGVPDHAAWYRRTVAHNTVVMDETDQAAAEGELLRFTPADDGGEVHARCAGAYPGATLERSLALHGDTLVDEFRCASDDDTERTWDYVLLAIDPIPTPDDAEPMEWNAAAGYDRIRDPRVWTPDGPVRLSLGTATVEIACDRPCRFIAGAGAPGFPGTVSITSSSGVCYPLIVRATAPTVTFRARWTVPEPEGSAP